MSENSQNVNISQIGKWLVERSYIWQMKLLDEESFLRFANQRDIGIGYFERDIKQLRKFWSLGLFRADLVVTEQSQKTEGLIFLSQNEDSEYIYADERKCFIRDKGYSNSLEEIEEVPDDIRLLFHPFRLFTLYKIEENAQSYLNSFAIYNSPDNYKKYSEFDITSFTKRTSTKDFQNKVSYWNDIVSLAVAAEPVRFRRVFGFFTIRYNYFFDNNKENEQLFYNSIQTHTDDFNKFLNELGIEKIKEIISDICNEVECIESNRDILILLRLMKGKYRLEELKGRLGLAIYILTMAEMIRRSAELAFNTNLPEEDESSFTGDEGSLKEYLYGTPRLLDSQRAKTQFVRNFELDYNIRLRWYVEGQTEFAALQSYLGNNTAMEIINLNGQIVAGQGKGVAFRENLLNDINRSVYSWILLDKDVSDNCRVVRQAAERNEMFGSYFFSDPDFEFKNFNLDELIEIVWEIALEIGADANDKDKLIDATKTAKSGKEFENLVEKSIPLLNKFSKGEEWGRRLMKFALNNKKKRMADGSYKMREIIEVIHLAHHAISCSYHLSRKNCKVNIETGRLINCK